VAVYAALFAVILVVSGLFWAGVLRAIAPDWLVVSRLDLRVLAMNAAALAVPAVVALYIVARFIDGAPIAVFGVALHDKWLRDLVVGFAVAAGMLALTVAGAFTFGNSQMAWTFTPDVIPTIVATLLVLAVSAANEELMFRGYPLQVLMKGLGPWTAILLLSCLFGVVHINNAGATTLSALNTMLAGVVLSYAYLKTRSLWLPYGIHLAWNAGLAVVLGYPVSGINTASFWTTTVNGPAEILGGGYGPEGGVLGTVVFSAGGVLLLALRRVGISPQIREALKANALKVWTGKA